MDRRGKEVNTLFNGQPPIPVEDSPLVLVIDIKKHPTDPGQVLSFFSVYIVTSKIVTFNSI